jgi:hypothetical protein
LFGGWIGIALLLLLASSRRERVSDYNECVFILNSSFFPMCKQNRRTIDRTNKRIMSSKKVTNQEVKSEVTTTVESKKRKRDKASAVKNEEEDSSEETQARQ